MNENTKQFEQIPTEAPLTEVELLQSKIREMQGELDFYKCIQSNYNVLLNVVAANDKAIVIKSTTGMTTIAIPTTCEMFDKSNVAVYTTAFLRITAGTADPEGDIFSEVLYSDNSTRKHDGKIIITPNDVVTVISKDSALKRICTIYNTMNTLYDFANGK